VSKDDNQVIMQSEEKDSKKDQAKLTMKKAAQVIGNSPKLNA
jgi:hypothetical protein